MKREIEILEELCDACEERMSKDLTAHTFAVCGNKRDYRLVAVGNMDSLEETIYCILSRDPKLLNIFERAVRLASELGVKQNNEE